MVKDQDNPNSPHRASPTHLILIGYRGSGKTTVGRLLADRLNARFVDTDDDVADHAGRSIADIFAAEGEAGFRRRESQVIARLTSHEPSHPNDPMVISLGGGAVLDDVNMTRLKAQGRIVWLTCSPGILHARITADRASSSARPALTADGGLDEIRTVLAQRAPRYRAHADLEISSEDSPPAELADAIADWFTART